MEGTEMHTNASRPVALGLTVLSALGAPGPSRSEFDPARRIVPFRRVEGPRRSRIFNPAHGHDCNRSV